MPVGWFIIPFTRTSEGVLGAGRRLAIDLDFPALRQTPGSAASYQAVEVRGARAVVKVNTDSATLQDLNAVYKRLPKDLLNSSLADLSGAQKTAIKNELADQGFTFEQADRYLLGNAAVDTLVGQGQTYQQIFNSIDLGNYTLRDVLRLMASRVFVHRYDSGTNSILYDGAEQSRENDVDTLDGLVT